MKYDVFLSHSSADQESIVTPLYEYLTENGIKCFYSLKSIPTGHSYTELIPDAIENSSLFFLVFTEYANSSDQIKKEVEIANSEKKELFCMKCSEQPYNNTLRYVFASTQYFNATVEYDKTAYFPQVLNDLKRLLSIDKNENLVANNESNSTNSEKYNELITKESKTHEDTIQYKIGEYLEKGIGVEKNSMAAVEWYQKAAEKDNEKAIIALAHCYENGIGVQKDLKTAYQLYNNKLYNDITGERCYHLANFLLRIDQLEDEVILDDDPQENTFINIDLYGWALSNLETSAERGFVPGMVQYAKEILVEEFNDFDSAINLYLKAAKRGSVEAMYLLGELYLRTDTEFYDKETAVYWLKQASELGSEDAKKILQKI